MTPPQRRSGHPRRPPARRAGGLPRPGRESSTGTETRATDWPARISLSFGFIDRLALRGRGAGKAARLVVAEGQGHNHWEGFFRCRELTDFVIERAKAGREAKGME